MRLVQTAKNLVSLPVSGSERGRNQVAQKKPCFSVSIQRLVDGQVLLDALDVEARLAQRDEFEE